MKCNTQKFEKQMQRNFLNNAALAKATGMSEKTISYYRTGRTEPRPGNLKKLCEALKCNPEDILDD